VTNQILVHEEIKRRLNADNTCYHSLQNLLSSRLLSKNIKIRLYKTIILPVVLYGRDEVTGCWRKLPNENLHDLYSCKM
jgi:hypothetical protein